MYKKENIVMLPSNQKAIYHGQPWLHGNRLRYHTGSVDGVTEQEITSSYCIPQHLYVLSDDEIKEGDWFYHGNTGISLCTKISGGMNIASNKGLHQISACKKIIATTDTSLHTGFAKTKCPKCNSLMKVHLPDHIECVSCGQKGWNLIQGVYNEISKLPQIPLSFIDYFVKQYNKGNIITEIDVEYWDGKHEDEFDNSIKINADNTINIKPIKDSFDINDIYKALKDKSCLADKKSMDEWIQRNL